MKIGPINIAIEGGGPGWKTTLVGHLKTITAVTGGVLAWLNVDKLTFRQMQEQGLPWWMFALAGVYVICSIAGPYLAQDKTYDGQQTASRAVVQPDILDPIDDAGVPTVAPEVVDAITQNVVSAIRKSRDAEAVRELMQRDAEKRAEAGILPEEERG